MNREQNTMPQFEKTEVAKAVELQIQSQKMRRIVDQTINNVSDILIGKLELNENDNSALSALEKLNEDGAKYEKVGLLAMQYAIVQMANTSDYEFPAEAANDDNYGEEDQEEVA